MAAHGATTAPCSTDRTTIVWQVPSVSSRIFAAWGCERFGSEPGVDRYYLRVDLSIECYSNEHEELQRLAFVFIIIWAIGVPCIYAGLLAKARASSERIAHHAQRRGSQMMITRRDEMITPSHKCGDHAA